MAEVDDADRELHAAYGALDQGDVAVREAVDHGSGELVGTLDEGHAKCRSTMGRFDDEGETEARDDGVQDGNEDSDGDGVDNEDADDDAGDTCQNDQGEDNDDQGENDGGNGQDGRAGGARWMVWRPVG